MSAYLHKTSRKAANNRLIWLHYPAYAGSRLWAKGWGEIVLVVERQRKVAGLAWFSGWFVVPVAVTRSMFALDRGPLDLCQHCVPYDSFNLVRLL